MSAIAIGLGVFAYLMIGFVVVIVANSEQRVWDSWPLVARVYARLAVMFFWPIVAVYGLIVIIAEVITE